MLLLAATALGWAGVVETCNADAESDNAGLSVTVKLGSVTQYSGGNLDAAFDEIAEHHTNSTISVTYNTNGRAALRQAMDCTFDNGYVTLSSAWIQAKISDLEVRSYGVAVFNSLNQLQWAGHFNAVDVISGVSHIRFNGLAAGHCAAVESSSLGSYDLQADFTITANIKSCTADGCTKCKRASGVNPCTCQTGDGDCDYTPIASGNTSNGAIIKAVM